MRRAVGIAARRLDRPQLLAAVDPLAHQAQREQVGINAALATSLRGGGAYVDVGANRGQVLAEAVRVAPRGAHVAFEPIPELAAELASSFPSVDCRQLALGAAPGEAEFCHFTTLDGWSGLRRSPQVSDAQGSPEYITVQVSTLDREIKARPAVIKIDVEGAELGVLEGGRSLLCDARPVLIFEHVADASALYDAPAEAPWDLLSELGYEIYAASGEGPFAREAFAEAARIVNWLAVPAGSAA
ncbi:MAG TPA: FkbM family methyltransferase [Solirubrobacteraceae bacterium]|nr:FkbM family methyltransferase [Solirubrobacteraceae bacterium]